METMSPEGLESWIAEYPAYMRERDGFEVRPERADEFLLLLGLAERVARAAEAYLVLAKSDFTLEAITLVRAAFEHAITLEWVFVTRHGVDQFQRQVDRDRIAYFRKLNAWLKNDEIAAKIKELRASSKGDRLLSFARIIAQLDDHEHTLQKLYDILSQQVHVTFGAVTAHLDEAEDGRLAIVHDPQDAMRHGTLYALAIACMLSWWVLANLTEDNEALVRLDRDSDKLAIPTNLAHVVSVSLRRPDL